MSNTIRTFRRIIGIVRTLARHDALFLFEQWGFMPRGIAFARLLWGRKHEGAPGERLALALHALGPAFIKLGQALSTRSDLLGEDIAKSLAMLRDQLPAFPTEQAIRIIEAEFNEPLSALYTQFDEQPVAAASIAQVHFALDTDGKEVAVKVLRPDIERQFQKDVDVLFWIAARVEKRLPQLKRLKLIEVVQVFSDAVAMEMDLRLEAAASQEMQQNFAGDASVHMPAIDWRRTSQRVLTMQRVQGIPIDDVARITAAGHEPLSIIQRAAETLFKMAFRDGFFHADMHPGNVFVGANGELILIDFGIMGRMNEETRFFIAEMLRAFLKRDYRRVAQLHVDAGYVPKNQSVEAFAQACRSIAEPILDLPQEKISIARLIAQLIKVSDDFQMILQPQLLLLQKSMMLAEGVGRALKPDVNMWKLAEPLIEDWARREFSPLANARRARKRARDILRKFTYSANAFERISACFTEEGIRLHPETVALLQRRE